MYKITALFLCMSFGVIPQATALRVQTVAEAGVDELANALLVSATDTGLEEVDDAIFDSSRRSFMDMMVFGAVFVGASMSNFGARAQDALFQPDSDPVLAHMRAMVVPDRMRENIAFLDDQIIEGRARMIPANIPPERLAAYEKARGKKFAGFDFNGLYDSYKVNRKSKFWDKQNVLAEYGRVWVYDTADAIKADLTLAHLHMERRQTEAAKIRVERAFDAIKAIVELGRDEEALGFEGGWHFSYNTLGDNWMDPRAPTGATEWVQNSAYEVIAYVLSEDAPDFVTAAMKQEALDMLEWLNGLVQKLNFKLQDRGNGLMTNMVANEVLEDRVVDGKVVKGANYEDVGYHAYVGNPNHFGDYKIMEHQPDAADVFVNAATTSDLAAKLDPRRFGNQNAEHRTFRQALPERRRRLLSSALAVGYNSRARHMISAIDPNGDIQLGVDGKPSVAGDNQYWVARMYMPYAPDVVVDSMEFAWENFRTKAEKKVNGRWVSATKVSDLMLEDIPDTPEARAAYEKYKDEDFAASFFFSENFDDPYVNLETAEERSRLVLQVQPETTWAMIDLALTIAQDKRIPKEVRDRWLKRARLLVKSMDMIQEIHGGLPYSTTFIKDLMSTLQGMAAEATAVVVKGRMLGAPTNLIGQHVPKDFTFMGIEPDAATEKPLIARGEVLNRPISVRVTSHSASAIELDVQLPKLWHDRPLYAVAAIHIENDEWYPVPFADDRALVRPQGGKLKMTTFANRSPFFGKNGRGATVDARRVLLFENEAAANAFLKDKDAGHAIEVFDVNEQGRATRAKKEKKELGAIGLPGSVMLASTTSVGTMGDIGPGSAAWQAAQQATADQALVVAAVANTANVSSDSVGLEQLQPISAQGIVASERDISILRLLELLHAQQPTSLHIKVRSQWRQHQYGDGRTGYLWDDVPSQERVVVLDPELTGEAALLDVLRILKANVGDPTTHQYHFYQIQPYEATRAHIVVLRGANINAGAEELHEKARRLVKTARGEITPEKAATLAEMLETVGRQMEAAAQPGLLRPKVNAIDASAAFHGQRVGFLPREDAQAVFVTDLHGDIDAFDQIRTEQPDAKYWVFGGDFVDGGEYSLDILLEVLAMALESPDTVFFMGGNIDRDQLAADQSGNARLWQQLEALETQGSDLYQQWLTFVRTRALSSVFTANGFALVHAGPVHKEHADGFDSTSGLTWLDASENAAHQMAANSLRRPGSPKQEDGDAEENAAETQRQRQETHFGPAYPETHVVGLQSTTYFLDSTGAQFILRGHDSGAPDDQTAMEGRVLTVHASGQGSATVPPAYAGVRSRYAVIPLNRDFSDLNAARPEIIKYTGLEEDPGLESLDHHFAVHTANRTSDELAALVQEHGVTSVTVAVMTYTDKGGWEGTGAGSSRVALPEDSDPWEAVQAVLTRYVKSVGPHTYAFWILTAEPVEGHAYIDIRLKGAEAGLEAGLDASVATPVLIDRINTNPDAALAFDRGQIDQVSRHLRAQVDNPNPDVSMPARVLEAELQTTLLIPAVQTVRASGGYVEAQDTTALPVYVFNDSNAHLAPFVAQAGAHVAIVTASENKGAGLMRLMRDAGVLSRTTIVVDKFYTANPAYAVQMIRENFTGSVTLRRVRGSTAQEVQQNLLQHGVVLDLSALQQGEIIVANYLGTHA